MTKHPLGTVSELGEEVIGALAGDLRDELVLPEHDDYTDARTVWNGLANDNPAVIVRANSADDVARALTFAREHDFEIAVSGGAHHQTGSAMVDNGLVVDLGEMETIDVDPEAQISRAGPGVRAEDALAETQEYGLAMPTGSSGGRRQGRVRRLHRRRGTGLGGLDEAGLRRQLRAARRDQSRVRPGEPVPAQRERRPG